MVSIQPRPRLPMVTNGCAVVRDSNHMVTTSRLGWAVRNGTHQIVIESSDSLVPSDESTVPWSIEHRLLVPPTVPGRRGN